MCADVTRMLRRMRRLPADRRGAAALEFAMTLPIFCALLIGGFAFGWTQHCMSSLRDALEQASRAVMLDPTMSQSAVQSLVQSKLSATADPNVTVSLQVVTASNGSKTATLTGNYSTTIDVPLVSNYPLTYSTSVVTSLPAM